MKTIFSPREKETPKPPPKDSLPVPTPNKRQFDLTDLYDELGRLRWSSTDLGWEKAIHAVRDEIKKMVIQNQSNS